MELEGLDVGLVLIVAVVTFAAGFTQAVAGFGMGLVCMSVLPFLMPVKEVVPFLIVLALAVNVAMLMDLRKDTEPKKFGPMVAGAFIGAPIGAYLLQSVDEALVIKALGVILVVYCGWQLTRSSSVRRALNTLWGFPAGVLGSILQAAFGTGGPPVVLYTTLTDWSPNSIRAQLQVFFGASNMLQIGLYIVVGLFTMRALALDAIALPALLLGVYVGSKVAKRINEVAFRRLVLGLLFVIGVVYLLR